MSNAIANQLYLAYLGRPADTAWRSSTTAVLNGGAPSVALQNAFYSAAVLDGAFSLNDSSSALVNKIFLNVFGFSASTFEQNAWATLINNGTITAQTAAWTIFSSYLGATNVPSTYQQPAQSKLLVIDAYTNQLANDSNANVAVSQIGSSAALSAKAFISTITSQATAAPAITGIATTVSGVSSSQTGSSFTLTSGVDNLTGTSSNDTFTADNTATAKQFTTADTINGGAGTDTLRVFNATADAIDGLTFSNLTSIESIFLSNGTLTNSKTLDVSSLSGVTSITLDSTAAMANSDVFTVKAASTQAITLSKVIGTTGGATSTVNINGGSGVTLNGVGTDLTLDLTSTGTSLALSTTGSASTVTLANTGAALATLNVSGSANLSLTESVNSIATVNGSSMTGNLSVNASGATVSSAFAFTGGSGNDTLTLSSTGLSTVASGAQLIGGTGTDILAITGQNGALSATKINQTTGFETLSVQFITAAGSFDVSTLTNTNFSTIQVGTGTTQAVTFSNATSASKFAFDNSAGLAQTTTISNQVGQSATSLTLATGSSTGNQTITGITLSGITTVALASTGSGTNVVTTLTNSDNSSITVTGAAPLTITNALAGTTTGSRYDASGATGAQTVVGSTKADILIGGSGNDTLTTALATTANQSDTLTGGAGADTFRINVTGTNAQNTDSASLYASSAGTTAIVKITDFVAGTDKIKLEIDDTAGTLVAGTSIVLATAQTIATAANLTAVYAGITAIGASTNGGALSGVVVTVSAGAAAGTYLYINDATAGVSNTADMLINITGISGTLSASDFVFA